MAISERDYITHYGGIWGVSMYNSPRVPTHQAKENKMAFNWKKLVEDLTAAKEALPTSDISTAYSAFSQAESAARVRIRPELPTTADAFYAAETLRGNYPRCKPEGYLTRWTNLYNAVSKGEVILEYKDEK